MLTRGERAPQHNSLLPANQKDVLAYVQQRSPLIFHQQCSGDVSHSLLQWHWACPGEHVAFYSTPSLSTHSLRPHQLLLSLRGFIYLGFLFSRYPPPLSTISAFIIYHGEPGVCSRSCTFGLWLPESSRDPSQTHTFTCI